MSLSDQAGTGSPAIGRPLSVLEASARNFVEARRVCCCSTLNGGANLSKFTVKLLCYENLTEWIEVGNITPAVTQASARSYLPRPLFPPLRQLSMSSRASTDRLLGDVDINPEYTTPSHTDNFDSCSAERRRQIEKSLLRKLDLRVSFLVLIWLMNIVGSLRECPHVVVVSSPPFRSTELISRGCTNQHHPPKLSSSLESKCCTTEWVRRRSSTNWSPIQHTDQHGVCWPACHANTIVGVPVILFPASGNLQKF